MATGFYDDPEVFDILHAAGTAREVDGLERIARKFCSLHGEGTRWLEPACGTGRYLKVAAKRGYRVVGIDLSPDMVKYARRAIGSPRGAMVADMTRFASKVGRVDFAFCLINSIRHLESDEAMVKHLREMRKALNPGAAYAVGLSTTAYGMESPSEDVWEGRRGAMHVKQVAGYFPPTRKSNRFEDVFSHLVITRGKGTKAKEEHREHAYRLRCYNTGQWEAVVKRAGMSIAAVTDERGETHNPGLYGYALYILRRTEEVAG